MKYLAQIMEAHAQPEQLETLYRQAEQTRRLDEFSEDLEAAYQASPGNLLFAAWHYRLAKPAEGGRERHWRLAVPLALACGLIFLLLSGDQFEIGDIPLFFLVWAPLVAAALLTFFERYPTASAEAPGSETRVIGRTAALGLGIGVLALAAYGAVMLDGLSSTRQDHYGLLLALHLPLAALAVVGVAVSGWKGSPLARFAFLTKALEATTTGGLMAIGVGIFTLVTTVLFEALDVSLGDDFYRLMIAGVGGSVPVLAVALVYDPARSAENQDFQHGLSRFVATIVRLLVAPTLVVAVIYTLFIPFNFFEPFQNRDALTAYNAMLFAVIGLMLAASPLRVEELSPVLQRWLRLGILIIGGLALLVSVYALAAVAYRTWTYELSMNRLTVLGWNIINIAILGLMFYRQLRLRSESWVASLQAAFNFGGVAYAVWAVFVVLALPWLFR